MNLRASRSARLFVALSAAAACVLVAAPHWMPVEAGTVPRQAPELEFKTVAGETVSLSALRGSVVAVLWMSTDCPHCQHTCEELRPVYRELKGRGLEILALAVNPMAPGNIRQFQADHGVEFRLGVSNRSEWMRFADLSVMARAYVPYLLLVDRSGTIRYEHRGTDQAFWNDQVNNLRKELAVLLAEPASAAR